MKYLQPQEFHLGDADSGEDAVQSTQSIEMQLKQLDKAVESLPPDATLSDRLKLTLDSCYLLLDLKRNDEAEERAREAFDAALPAELWTQAVEACDVLFQSGREDAIQALAHGIWLGVTFPIDPELSVAMLQHLIDETPDRSDGAAVAAATASYIVDIRAEGQQREDLQLFTGQMLAQVARRHSQVEDQEIFDFWVERLELNDPDKFLPRLAKVLDIITNDNWWFDRHELRSKIPEE
jgi:tetratricopeptide (TPR) repeat protein